MKNHLMKKLWMPVVGLLIFAVSCKKQDLPTEETESQPVRAFGALPDDPDILTKVPLIVSRDYLLKTSAAGTGKGKGGGKPGSGSTTSDVTPPTVSITSPANSSSVTGTVSISVSANDNVGIKSIVVKVGSTTLGSSGSSPYTVSWNTSNYPDGVHTIQATATDAAGNWATSSVSVTKNTSVVVEPPPPPPSSTGFSLSMPPVGYQGTEYSCVAFAVGYAARSAEYYYRTNATSYSTSTNVFSPEFLYNVTKFGSDCGSGSNVSLALDYLTKNGICRWQTMPYSYTDGCSTTPSSTQMAEAANYKINGYSALYKSDIAGIKSMLQSNHPVIFTVNLDNSFTNAQPGFIWKSYTASPGAGHSMVICGFDDSKNAWKVMNSWGTSWCESGYGWIDYNFFPKTGSEWVFVIN